jgi:tRNA threonylcarbamoyl adenosine modification protein YjeE
LGAGKTAFARAVLRALGVTGEVPSPTFTLLQTYDTTNFTVYHFDLYRLKNKSELEELGWDDACADGVAIVEWPERAEGHMPDNYLLLKFSMDEENNRFCDLQPFGVWAQRLKEMS